MDLKLNTSKIKRRQKVFAALSFFTMSLVTVQGIVFAWIHLGQKEFFVKLIYDFAAIGVGFLSLLKVFVIFFRKHKVLLQALDMLEISFPKDMKMQTKFELEKNFSQLKFKNLIYEILNPLLLVTFVLSPFLISTFKYFFVTGAFERKLPYFLWFPFGLLENGPMIYVITYIMTVLGGMFGVFFHLAIDLLLFGILAVLCLEFSILKKKFEEFGKHETKAMLAQLINEHNKLIE